MSIIEQRISGKMVVERLEDFSGVYRSNISKKMLHVCRRSDYFLSISCKTVTFSTKASCPEKFWLLMNELNVWQKIVAGVLNSTDGPFLFFVFFL